MFLKTSTSPLTVESFLVLLGPSGCGKFTLLNCITGLLKFNSGNIYINENNVNAIHPSKRDIAMVFQSYALYPNMTVRKNISFEMKIRKVPKNEIKEKIEEIANILNIKEILSRKPSDLSGGQQQRVAIARALVRNPQLFLFDEPLSNLDAKLKGKMRMEINRLHKTFKSTTVYVTHDQIEAMTLADKIAVMNRGKIVQFGTPSEIYFKPENVFVANFIGSPPMNLIPAHLEGNKSKLILKIKDANNIHKLDIPLNKSSQGFNSLKNYLDKEIILGIRPENIHFSAVKKKNSIPIKIDFVEHQGADSLVILSLNDHEVICKMSNEISHIKTNFYLDLEKALYYDKKSEERIK